MASYKAGDRVRVLTVEPQDIGRGFFVGVVGTADHDCGECERYLWVVHPQTGTKCQFRQREIEPAQEEVSPTPVVDDAVMRPAHYARYAIEPVTFITANSIAFLPGNVIKYVLRYDAKNGLEDLRKAKRYLEIMIEDVERRAAGNPIKVESV